MSKAPQSVRVVQGPARGPGPGWARQAVGRARRERVAPRGAGAGGRMREFRVCNHQAVNHVTVWPSATHSPRRAARARTDAHERAPGMGSLPAAARPSALRAFARHSSGKVFSFFYLALEQSCGAGRRTLGHRRAANPHATTRAPACWLSGCLSNEGKGNQIPAPRRLA